MSGPRRDADSVLRASQPPPAIRSLEDAFRVITGGAPRKRGADVHLRPGRALSGLFASLLFGVQPTDLSIYAIVAALLLTAGLLAAGLPANRAARADPIAALRSGEGLGCRRPNKARCTSTSRQASAFDGRPTRRRARSAALAVAVTYEP
jgi:hypothetical protein